MKQVKKSILLWYTAREMYDLVLNVREYPQFMPWCERAEVLEESDQGMTARLYLSYRGVRQSFTTRNTHAASRSVAMHLVDGPFSRLDGHWEFVPVGEATANACRIHFQMNYTFANTALELVVSPVFDRIANTFVDAFVERAERVYGAR
ncbi:MAG TPA: type II toxin-antitoxin system RatA family toxin [Burkholderiaceae bacterium]|nr:type II toxin-antitoxin system RatA family toxin [Burkholderiaceae bacterium]